MQGEQIAKRNNRLDSIRSSLKGNQLFQRNTLALETKIEKRKQRKESLSMTVLEDEFLKQVDYEEE